MTPAGLSGRACIVGIGQSDWGRRGTLTHLGPQRLALQAIRAAAADAGIDHRAVDGLVTYGDDAIQPQDLSLSLGIPHLRYAGMTWRGGGSGLPTALASAAMAVATGIADHVVVFRSIVQGRLRLGGTWAGQAVGDGDLPLYRTYAVPFGLVVPPALYALRVRRHMAVYGTTTDHLAAVAVTARRYAAGNPHALFRDPITVEDHHASRIVVDPYRLFDCCMESDGAAAVIVTTPERARDLRQPGVAIRGISMTTERGWGSPIAFTEPDEVVATSGHATAAEEVYRAAGLGPEDVDVALLYDGSTGSLLLGIEDWGLCPRGEAGPFVAEGHTGPGGSRPVNTHGGSLAEVYLQGTNHLLEAVRQLRGTSANQLPGCEVALYASGVGYVPMGGALLTRLD